MSLKYLSIAAVLLVGACSAPVNAPPFRDALDAHFQAIQDRDIDAYTATITDAANLPMIFPDGSFLPTRASVIEFHTSWFEDKNWIMNYEIVGTRVKGEMAVATVRYEYRDTADGPPRYAYLGLVFELENGAWKLIHDQNTRINLVPVGEPQ